MEKISRSLAETEAIARDFLTRLTVKRGTGCAATIIGLRGDLGAGKTAFTQAVARILGIKDKVQSPTFVLIRNYIILKNHWRKLVHIDCYRLASGADLLKLGWRELTATPTNLIFIEWPERVTELLPPETSRIYFEFINETGRKIIYD